MNLLDILRDPIWTLLIGVAGLVIPIFLAIKQSSQKKTGL